MSCDEVVLYGVSTAAEEFYIHHRNIIFLYCIDKKHHGGMFHGITIKTIEDVLEDLIVNDRKVIVAADGASRYEIEKGLISLSSITKCIAYIAKRRRM